MGQFYLVDDDRGVISLLKLIIESNGCGEVCGFATNGEDALEDLRDYSPDIVIVDLLMPRMDGITFIQKARKAFEGIHYIMLSQVSSKEMIAQAYDSGVEFFLQKPINSVEVMTVINKVNQYIHMSRAYRKMASIFREVDAPQPEGAPLRERTQDTCRSRVAAILQKLGIGGDAASRDICEIVSYIVENRADMNVNELCRQFSDSPKAMEQRIRRAITTGMINLAHMGLEDYHNDTFEQYAGTLYRFEQVHREMDYIRGKTDLHGKISMRAFLYTMADFCAVAVD